MGDMIKILNMTKIQNIPNSLKELVHFQILISSPHVIQDAFLQSKINEGF